MGAGSGVSTFAVSLAVQAGARVLVTSSSQEKIERAKELGADGGVLYTEEGWPEAAGPVDVVLDSVGTTWRDALRALRRGGRLVVFGGTGGPEVTLDVAPSTSTGSRSSERAWARTGTSPGCCVWSTWAFGSR